MAARQTVTGIGGFFFRAKDPKALSEWYAKTLGVGSGPYGVWKQKAGDNVFSPFQETSDYFAADRRWMLNFRVRDIDAMIAQLRADGVTVETRPEWNDPQVGRFARIHDPEDNPIELWEPPKA